MHASTAPGPVSVVCRYVVKPGHEQDFAGLLGRHWKTLHASGLVTDTPARIRKCVDQRGRTAFIEEFAWKGAQSAGIAHSTPAVMQMWEPMGAYCSDMEFWHAQEFDAAQP